MLVFNIVILQISVSHDEIQKNGETVKNSGWMCHSEGSYVQVCSLFLSLSLSLSIPYFIVILPLCPFIVDSSISLKNIPISITLFVVCQPLFIALHHQYVKDMTDILCLSFLYMVFGFFGFCIKWLAYSLNSLFVQS